MGSFSPKYITLELRKCKGLMFDGTQGRYKIVGKLACASKNDTVKLHSFKVNKSVYIATRSYRFCCQYVIIFSNISIKTVIKGLHYFKVNKSVHIASRTYGFC